MLLRLGTDEFWRLWERKHRAKVDGRMPDIQCAKQAKPLIHPTHAFALEDELCKEAVLIKLIPGMNPPRCSDNMEMDIRGIVIEAFVPVELILCVRIWSALRNRRPESVVGRMQSVSLRIQWRIYRPVRRYCSTAWFRAVILSSDAYLCYRWCKHWGKARIQLKVKRIFESQFMANLMR